MFADGIEELLADAIPAGIDILDLGLVLRVREQSLERFLGELGSARGGARPVARQENRCAAARAAARRTSTRSDASVALTGPYDNCRTAPSYWRRCGCRLAEGVSVDINVKLL